MSPPEEYSTYFREIESILRASILELRGMCSATKEPWRMHFPPRPPAKFVLSYDAPKNVGSGRSRTPESLSIPVRTDQLLSYLNPYPKTHEFNAPAER